MRNPALLFFMVLFHFSAAAMAQTTAPTPIAPPTGRHSAAGEISKHTNAQCQRINKALAARIITIEQVKTLRALVELTFTQYNADCVKNKVQKITPDQEKGLFQLLNNSAHAIDQAVGPSTNPS